MADTVSKKARSRIMSSIRSKNTKPEIMVRRIIWSMGKRYRIHDKSIVGTPDISNKKKKIVVFIDGCFWHGCKTCYKEPRTNVRYWRKKIIYNQKKRSSVLENLMMEGMNVLEIWEHEIRKNPIPVASKIAKFL